MNIVEREQRARKVYDMVKKGVAIVAASFIITCKFFGLEFVSPTIKFANVAAHIAQLARVP